MVLATKNKYFLKKKIQKMQICGHPPLMGKKNSPWNMLCTQHYFQRAATWKTLDEHVHLELRNHICTNVTELYKLRAFVTNPTSKQ